MAGHWSLQLHSGPGRMYEALISPDSGLDAPGLAPGMTSPHRGGSSPDWSSQSDHRCFVVGCHHLDLSIEVARQPPTSEKFLDVGEAQFHPVLSLDVLHQDGDGDWSFVVEDLLDVFRASLYLSLSSSVSSPQSWLLP